MHPAQILFTEKHPLTSILELKFNPVVDHVLKVELSAPQTFADSNPEFVHSGLNTLLLDTVMGASVLGELPKPQPIATVKLTCSHLAKARVGEAIVCIARYDGEQHEIAYVTGEIRTADDNRLLSTALGTFMIGTTGKPLGSKG